MAQYPGCSESDTGQIDHVLGGFGLFGIPENSIAAHVKTGVKSCLYLK
jgi:hypothetical protein